LLNPNSIFKLTEKQFNQYCLDVFKYQYSGVEIYRKFVDLININPEKIKHYTEIPFLPIQFFKN